MLPIPCTKKEFTATAGVVSA